MKSYILKIVLISLLVYVTGCASVIKTYSGPELPEQQIAILTCDCGITIGFIDWTKIDKRAGCKFYKEKNKFLLLPGVHNISTTYGTYEQMSGGRGYMIFKSVSVADIEFEALAGHQYHIYSGGDVVIISGTIKRGWDPYIVDVSDKHKIVGRGIFREIPVIKNKK